MHLALDVMLPTDRIVDALKTFRAEFPTVTLHLHMEALGGVTQLVLDRAANIGVSGPLPGNAGTPGVERIGLGSVVLIPVAAPGHPTRPGPSSGPLPCRGRRSPRWDETRPWAGRRPQCPPRSHHARLPGSPADPARPGSASQPAERRPALKSRR